MTLFEGNRHSITTVSKVTARLLQGQPGFLGYLVAGPASEHHHEFIFASIWANADAVKARFGEEWHQAIENVRSAGVIKTPPLYREILRDVLAGVIVHRLISRTRRPKEQTERAWVRRLMRQMGLTDQEDDLHGSELP